MSIKKYLIWSVYASLIGFFTLIFADKIGITSKLETVIILIIVYVLYFKIVSFIIKHKEK